MRLPVFLFQMSLWLGTNAQDCQIPRESFGPLPPVLPENFHMVYEKINLVEKTAEYFDVWYSWKEQKARVERVDSMNKGKVMIFDFEFSSSFGYNVPRPDIVRKTDEATGESSDGSMDQDASLNYEPITPDLYPNLYFFNPSERPVRMSDVYHSLLFGGPFRFKFAGNVSDDSSRFIKSNKFEGCVVDESTGKLLKVVYYWTQEDDMEKPVKCERTGDGVDEVLSIIRFDRDPQFPPDVFSLPRHKVCANHPGVVDRKNFPAMSDDFAWRQETFSWSSTEEGVLYGNIEQSYREVWVTDLYKIARLDWTPRRSEVEGTTFESFAGRPLSIIADIPYRAVFITDKINGRCVVKPLTEDFPLSVKVNGTYKLKKVFDLIGMDGPRALKGEYVERNGDVLVYTSNYTTQPNAEFATAHETSLRFDVQQATESFGAFQFVPVSQLTQRIASDPEGENPARLSYEQTSYFRYSSEHRPLHLFSAPGCIVHHKRKVFELRFAGSTWGVISGRKDEFVDELRHQIYLRGDLDTLMRVQAVNAYEASDVLATVTLLEPLEEIDSEISISIDEAAQRIAKDVDEGNFAVPFVFEGGDQLIAVENSFRMLNPTSSVANLRRSRREVVQEPDEPVSPDSGYSLGTFIGVCFAAFVLGIGGGLSYIYFRARFNQTTQPDVVPLGEMEQSLDHEHIQEAGPSGWKANEVY
ncbi:uncharacterized protein LOC100900623 [Galendromus occidentalis]|uniref:Uncharacterized protein LOC100900623 n=1 Tax=Galendromus occidentalis TaxID=34638 RepID=A0AAJ6QQC2_9ACAR|nr:uncharacterized protein LOC100900623 [Galendromus occidentalis]